MLANHGDAVARWVRQIKYEFHAKRHAAAGAGTFEPDGDAAAITSNDAGGDTCSRSRTGACTSSDAGAGSSRESRECAGAGTRAATRTASAIGGARGHNFAGDSGDVDQFVQEPGRGRL